MSDLLSPDEILRLLNQTENPFESLHVFETIDSTNEWCLQQCKSGLLAPFACVAETQSSGRGRRGRVWNSAAGASITMSYVWPFALPLDRLGMLSLAIGKTVVDELREIGINNVMLKWPNDVIVDGRKIAGILIETVMFNGQLNVIVGLGLNYDRLNTNEIDDNTEHYADVCQSLGKKPAGGRVQLIANLLRAGAKMCQQYEEGQFSLSGEFDASYNAFLNQPVNVLLANGDICRGVSTGVTTTGELRVEVEGIERIFHSAEVSLRRAD